MFLIDRDFRVYIELQILKLVLKHVPCIVMETIMLSIIFCFLEIFKNIVICLSSL